MNIFKKSTVFSFLLLALFSGCGRKKNIFNQFNQTPSPAKINKLTLPAVHNLAAKNHDKTIELTWQPIEQLDQKKKLCGYNVYAFAADGFIPKKPINHKPIAENFYSITQPKRKTHYSNFLVRGVFIIDGRRAEGPSSRVIKIDQ